MQQEFPNAKMTAVYRQMEHYYSLAQWSACPVQRWRYEHLMMGEMRRFMDLSRREQRAITETLQQRMAFPSGTPTPREDVLNSMRACPTAGGGREETPSNTGQPLPTFTLADLAQYNGSGGRPAYVAVNGIVYDVGREATWGGATHFGLYAGRDLSKAFNGCHGNMEILQELPQVGVLVTGTEG